MNKLTCKKCGLIDEPKIIVKGKQHVAFCSSCDAFIKNIPYDIPRFYFGRYKGTPIAEVTDTDYLKWFLENVEKISSSTRENILKQLDKLNPKYEYKPKTPSIKLPSIIKKNKVRNVEKEIVSACIMKVEVEHNGYGGGDSGHGGYTEIKLKNISSCDFSGTSYKIDAYGNVHEVTILVGGDCERDCLVEALEFAVNELKNNK